MPFIQYPAHRFDKWATNSYMEWDPHLMYPALTPVAQLEACGYGPGMSGAYRTGELPGLGWSSQSFADNPSPADLLRLGSRVPTQADALLAQMQAGVRM